MIYLQFINFMTLFFPKLRWQSRRMCTNFLLWELQSCNSLLNNHRQENFGSYQKKISHIQGQREALIKITAATAAKLLQSCPTLCDPIDGSPPGCPVPGISRQEHWSGLPFPSPVHESEKWKWSRSFVSDSSRPHGLQPTRLLHPWDFPGKSTGVGCHCLLQ